MAKQYGPPTQIMLNEVESYFQWRVAALNDGMQHAYSIAFLLSCASIVKLKTLNKNNGNNINEESENSEIGKQQFHIIEIRVHSHIDI